MTEEKLKPCPFCGGIAYIDREDIFCDCGVKLPLEPFYYKLPIEIPMMERWKMAREEAIELWNGRSDE